MADSEKRDFARAVREAYARTETGGDGAKERLLDRLREAPPPRVERDVWRRFAAAGRTQTRVALIAAGLMVLVGGGLLTRAVDFNRTPPAPARAAAIAGDRTVVRFALDAPGAERVALVGDFNDWDPAATPMRRETSRNTWSVSLPVTSGRHVYGFVVDRERWLPDPGAPRAPEDGFGTASSVIVVNGGEP